MPDEPSIVPVYSILYPSPGFHTFGGRRVEGTACVTRDSHSDAWATAIKLPRPAEAMLVGWKRR